MKSMMSHEVPYIISGPVDVYNIPKESVGKIIFDRLMKRNPDSVINVDAATGETLTCEKLLKDSMKLKHIFKELSLAKNDTIAIISENSINYLVPILAAFYMGIAVNPLNPDYKIGELKHALLISKPKLILCSEKVIKQILQAKNEFKFINEVLLVGPNRKHLPDIDRIEKLLEVTSADTDHLVPEEFDCSQQGALISFSSGTTGLPKGVLITHQNLRLGVACFCHPKYGNIQPKDVTVAVLPLFHVYGIITHMAAIINCMKSVIMNKFKPDLYLKSIQEHKATKLFCVPPMLVFLAKSPLVDDYDVSSVKDLIVAGAPVGAKLLNETSERLGSLTIRQSYGLTEASGTVTLQPTDGKKPGSIGTIVPHMVAKVWNPNTKKTVGPLKTGEICFKGPMLMKGYIGSSTASENFIDEDGFYHTGDLGFYDDVGNFYIVDRLKELIKYKGFQVPPAELEALILTHPLVRDCGVIGIPDVRAGQLPLAFVVPRSGANLKEKQIIDFVADKISVQKRLHGGVIFISEIPKSPSGKILRRELIEIFKKST